MGPAKQLRRVRVVDSRAAGLARGLGGWPRWFRTTIWPNVRRAGQTGDQEAWSDLCQAYWYPIYSFIRGLGRLGPEEAEDVTQGFFATLLKPGALSVANPAKGKFRTWLRTCARNFFRNYVKRLDGLTFGGGNVLTGIDIENTDKDFWPLLQDEMLTPDQLFDRCWALTVTELAMVRLKEAYVREGKGDLFRDLHGRLAGEKTLSDADLAALFGKKKGAIKTERSRRNDDLEARYQDFLRAEIAKTVWGEQAIDAELRHLFGALGLALLPESRPR